MMPTITTQVAGLAQLFDELKKLSADMQTKALRGATMAAAQVLRKRAREIALARNYDTGLLHRSIVVRYVKKESNAHKQVFDVKVSRAAPHWIFHEFGTEKMAADPFLVPAFEQEKAHALDVMKRVLAARIAKAQKAGTP